MDNVDVDHALAVVGNRLEKDPDDWEAWAAKADLLYSKGLYETAIRCCDRSLKMNPNNAFTWNTKGSALQKLGRRGEAGVCYNHAKDLEPHLSSRWIYPSEIADGNNNIEPCLALIDKTLLNPYTSLLYPSRS